MSRKSMTAESVFSAPPRPLEVATPSPAPVPNEPEKSFTVKLPASVYARLVRVAQDRTAEDPNLRRVGIGELVAEFVRKGME
jgi:hypothetical protein